MNTAALKLGMKGVDRSRPQAAPLPANEAAPVAEGGAPLAAHRKETWNQACTNQLDRAAWIYGDIENYWKQNMIVQVCHPTSEFHSRPPRVTPDMSVLSDIAGGRCWGSRGTQWVGTQHVLVGVSATAPLNESSLTWRGGVRGQASLIQYTTYGSLGKHLP